MSFAGHQEVLETIGEIESFVSGLDPDLTDKKTISDVMLAWEKILPDVKSNLSSGVGKMSEALAMLYEKFLMEMVEDGSRGIELTLQGLGAVRQAIEGSAAPEELDATAMEVAGGVVSAYGLEVEGVEAGPGPASVEHAAAGEEDDDFFAKLGDEKPPEPKAEEEEGEREASPEAEKLSQLASDITMLDADLKDKKAVADMMLALEELTGDLAGAGVEEELIKLASALSLVYEKSIMEGIEDGQKAIDLSTDGVMLLSARFEKASAGDLTEQARALTNRIEESFGVKAAPPPAAAPAPAAPPDEAAADAAAAEPAQEEAEPAPAPLPTGEVAPIAPESMTVATDEDLIIYSEFVSEVSDAVSNIESDLLELEEDPVNEELINNLFRAYHSMKGAAGFLGVNTVNILCHEAETLLDKFRKKIMVCNQDMIDALLKAVDVVKLVNEGLSSACEKAKSSMPNAELEIPRYHIDSLVALLAALSEGKLDAAAAGGEAEERAGGEVDVSPLGEMLVKEGKVSTEALKAALDAQQKKPLGQILVDMGATDNKTVSEALQSQAEKKKKVQAASLKIDTEKLDSLLELVGELVITQSIVSQDDVLLEEFNRSLSKNIISLGKITKNIQDHVMTLRMIPLKQTFQKMSRLVRDLSKKMKKPVNFVLEGEETEIDKTLIEELNDPLVHLLRNSMDHGLEPSEERAAAGKEKTGEIKLEACHRGGNVIIEVSDNGKGLDSEKIRKKGVEKGLIAADAELTEQEAFNLIMMPGFSTHDVATDISGRGVGMDVVRSNIDKLGGRLEISSRPGEGSTFTIKLPLTMAIVDGMIVKIGGDRFVIPTISIRESIRPRQEEISTYKNEGEMIDVRGKLLPLVRLHRFLGIDDALFVNPWEGLVIVVENEDKEFGFMVDDLLGQQQVVIKSLDKRFKGLPGISGGTILGDGHVGLILDVSGVLAAN